MICPHCGKETDLVYVDGTGMSRTEAENQLKVLLASLDVLQKRGAYQPGATYDINERYDKRLKESNALEVVLGY